MRRILLLIGPAIAIIGSVGLVLFGRATVGVFDLLIMRYDDPQPAALADLQLLALSGIALTIGLVITCCATVMRDSKQTISTVGRALYIVAGGLLVVGTVPTLWAIVGVNQGFHVIATASSTPKLEEVEDMIQSTAPAIAIGSGIFAVAAVVLFLASLIGFKAATPAQVTDKRRVLSFLAVTGSAFFGIIVSVQLIVIWFQTSALAVLLTERLERPISAADIGVYLSGVITKSLLVFIGLAWLGIMQVLTAICAPSSGTDVRTDDTI